MPATGRLGCAAWEVNRIKLGLHMGYWGAAPVDIMPLVMEATKKARVKADQNTAGRELYRPYNSNEVTGDEVKAVTQGDKIAKVLWQAYDLWKDAYDVKQTGNAEQEQAVAIDARGISGTHGVVLKLFDATKIGRVSTIEFR